MSTATERAVMARYSGTPAVCPHCWADAGLHFDGCRVSAMASDLLAALRELLEAADDYMEVSEGARESLEYDEAEAIVRGAKRQARAAIAKAEGRKA